MMQSRTLHESVLYSLMKGVLRDPSAPILAHLVECITKASVFGRWKLRKVENGFLDGESISKIFRRACVADDLIRLVAESETNPRLPELVIAWLDDAKPLEASARQGEGIGEYYLNLKLSMDEAPWVRGLKEMLELDLSARMTFTDRLQESVGTIQVGGEIQEFPRAIFDPLFRLVSYASGMHPWSLAGRAGVLRTVHPSLEYIVNLSFDGETRILELTPSAEQTEARINCPRAI